VGPPNNEQAFKLVRFQASSQLTSSQAFSIRFYRRKIMKTIKVYVEGGVVTDVIIPEEFHNKLNYEVIDYDNIEAEEDKKNAKERS
jgi:hypothetical protein